MLVRVGDFNACLGTSDPAAAADFLQKLRGLALPRGADALAG